MSAYGSISAPLSKASLEPLVFPLKSGTLSTYPISAADAPKELVEYLYQVFAQEVEDGKTYPQEGVIDYDAFFTYFFATASSTIIGIVHPASSEITSAPATIEEARGGRSWQECVGGCYYIKPNYPGRASHNCNAGFIVPPSGRGNGSGGGLAKSFLTYAPALGYRASVFNLVFENNIASLRLWERLGFEKVGRIPQAGRLKTGPGGAEEYVDAIIIYKSFV